MVGKHKSSGKTKRVARSEANLGQKDAELQKTQAELEKVSEAQFSHMEGGKAARPLLNRRRKSSPNNPRHAQQWECAAEGWHATGL